MVQRDGQMLIDKVTTVGEVGEDSVAPVILTEQQYEQLRSILLPCYTLVVISSLFRYFSETLYCRTHLIFLYVNVCTGGDKGECIISHVCCERADH